MIVASVICFVSCQKGGNESNDGIADNIYIDKIIQLDTSYSPGLDTIQITEFSYDGQKRLVQAKITAFVHGTHNVDHISINERLYIGSSNFPYKSVNRGLYPNNNSDTTFHFYNSQDQIVKDSTVIYVNNNGHTKIVYKLSTYASGSYMAVAKRYDFPTGSFVHMDSFRCQRTMNPDNLVSMFDSVYYTGNPFVDRFQTTNTYDTRKNPFSKLSMNYLFYPFDYDIGIIGSGGGIEYLSTNNFLTQNITQLSPSGGTLNYTTIQMYYTYDNNDYPVIIKGSSNLLGINSWKWIISYRTL